MITALYVRKDSIYKKLGLDCYDQDRNAINYNGNNVVIAHPPCRLWGRLSHMSTADPSEKKLAIHAVEIVRNNGGVLEHPYASKLWSECKLPAPGLIDEYGGFTLSINQHWFGHLAQKKTLLYIVGTCPKDIPAYPIKLDAVTHTIGGSRARGRNNKKETSHADREHTPIDLALWLIDLCKMIENKKLLP